MPDELTRHLNQTVTIRTTAGAAYTGVLVELSFWIVKLQLPTRREPVKVRRSDIAALVPVR